MADKKRYYWIKLKTDFFNQETMDFLMAQENGCQYIVLYQMLCLQSANNHGELATRIGEVIIPYDIKKIVRDTKYFDFDTVTVALELFTKLGLIYQQEDQVLRISNFEEMVGSETAWAEKKRVYRQKIAKIEDNTEDNSRTMSDKRLDIRDKRLDIRNIDIEKEKEKEREREKKRKRFTPPTLEEVTAYCNERNNNIDPSHFIDYYTSNGWLVGKNRMKDWKAAVRTWERNGFSSKKKQTTSQTAQELNSFYEVAATWAESEDKE